MALKRFNLDEELPDMLDNEWFDGCMGELEDFESLEDNKMDPMNLDLNIDEINPPLIDSMVKDIPPRDCLNYESDNDTVEASNPEFYSWDASSFVKQEEGIDTPPTMQRCHTLSSTCDPSQLSSMGDTSCTMDGFEPAKQVRIFFDCYEPYTIELEEEIDEFTNEDILFLNAMTQNSIEQVTVKSEPTDCESSINDETCGKPRIIVKYQPLDVFYKDEGGRGNQLRCTVALGGTVDGNLFDQHKTAENLKTNSIPLLCTVVLEDGTVLSQKESNSILSFVAPPRLDLKTRIADFQFRFERTSVNFRKLRMQLRVEVPKCNVTPALTDPVKVLSKRKRLKSVVRNRLTREREVAHELQQRKRLKLSHSA